MNLTPPTQHTNGSAPEPFTAEEIAVLRDLARHEMRDRVFREVDYHHARQRFEGEEASEETGEASS
jgi:hypothetical protein